MVADALDRHGGEPLLQALEVVGAPHLDAIRGAEHEVAEGEVLDHEPAQLGEQRVGALEQEGGSHLGGGPGVLGPARLEQDGQIGQEPPHHARQVEARGGRERPAARELDIGDQAQQLTLIAREMGPGFVERAAQEDLGPRPQPHQLVREVDALADAALGLADQLGVDGGQERGVVADVVLDHDDDAHAGRRVVLHVAGVLDALDDGDQDARVALPQEDALDVRGVVSGDEALALVVVIGQHHDRHVEAGALDLARERRGVHVAGVDGRDDEVEPPLGPGERQRLGRTRDVGESGRVVEGELQELAEDQLVEPAVLLEREGVVEARDQQDVLDPIGHQVLERLERTARRRRHERLVGTEHGHPADLPRAGRTIPPGAKGIGCGAIRPVPGPSSRRRP